MTNGTNGKAGPLDGIRVIDWTMWQFGPVSTMMLADMGAEVIKVESLNGDDGRQFGIVGGINSDLPEGVNAYYEGMNRNKRGIALDLKHPKGREIMYRLVEKSDVFVENFRKGVAERLGLGYEDLVKLNPTIIYGSASGYGPEGPDSIKPAFALTGDARSGGLFWAGPPDGIPYSTGIADQAAGIMLSYGVLGALFARERFGFGQKVDASHLGSMLWTRGMQNGISLLTRREFQRDLRTRSGNVLWNTYKCKDNKWIAFSMGQSDRYWPMFCKALDRLDLVEDPRFSGMKARRDNREELIALLDEIFASRPRDEWENRLTDAGDLIWERVQQPLDVADDPQAILNSYIVDFDHPVIGPSKWLQTPVTYSKTPVTTRKMAPAHGEDTEDILINMLGYTWDDIASLQEAGVIL
ncbi:MAG: CoA transferase [Chloroflexi bacterium]|nr:CoA transferase [Chloroflexota bacterium]